MYEIYKTDKFDKWLRKLKDRRAVAKILLRIQRIEVYGNFGDCESVGGEVKELRIHYSKGYRVYLTVYGNKIVILLIGGTKSTQQTDINKARKIWAIYKTELGNDEN